ncbi:hypothetical protein [Victivallis vadensis]|uniref:hypothetical protein n=1 Tax=Victivallis vadensis TaxID=172901 RepID=UPI002598BC6B|nr:hypothetical protein [uncultured Victivallis sp.]
MRRRREDASSLELLLDTMCNTFGGVMFIAISLVVVISMVRSASRALEENAPRKLEQLQQELARLEREAAESRESVEQRRELAGLLAAGPMREELEMLAAQEAQVRRLTDRKLAQEAKSAVLRADAAVRREALAKLRPEIDGLEAKRSAAEAARRELEQKQEIIRANLDSSPAGTLHFKVLRQSSRIPWFLVVRNGRVWRVGPGKRNGRDVPEPDVEFTVSGTVVSCTLKPGAGVPALADGKISPELRRILDAVPGNRVPEFWVDPDSAEEFFTVREQLKQEKVMHGWGPALAGDHFEYHITTQATHEY